jgi:hypothetical protein
MHPLDLIDDLAERIPKAVEPLSIAECGTIPRMLDPDPTLLLRIRDGVYAPDLLIVAVAELDL